ncbi:MAG TPA: RNA polymerase sigma factor [Opitutaceae bacterium]
MASRTTGVRETTAARFEDRALSHLDSLYNRALDLTGSRDAASELVKETFVRALRAFTNNGPENPGRAWMFAIMFSILAQERPEGTRRPEADPSMLLDGTEPFNADFPDGADLARIAGSESVWNGRHVAALVDRLPDEHRDAVILVDVDQFSHEEAAQVLRGSVSVLRARLFRARRVLFAKLTESVRSAGRTGGAES